MIRAPITIDISTLDKHHDAIHIYNRPTPLIINRISIQHNTSITTCKIESYYDLGTIYFNAHEIIDFSEYMFIMNVETIYVETDDDCNITDYTCFKKLQQFHLTSNCYKFITKLRLPNTLNKLIIQTNISIVGMTLPSDLQTIIIMFNSRPCYSDSEFDHSLTGFTFPSNLKRIEIIGNHLSTGIVFPDNLRELVLDFCHKCPLTDVIFPDRLRFIDFGYNTMLKDIVLPKYIEQIRISYNGLMSITDAVLPETLTCLELTYCDRHLSTCKIIIPSNFMDIKTYYHIVMDKRIIYPDTLRKLTIIDRELPSLDDLPRSIEELSIHSVLNNVTNLPMGLKKITISDMTDDDVKIKFNKLPYGCIVTII
ncbi:MAG: hypothetical protein Gaeavirus14_10 [Gaeavirus sp.]|uniref:Uncharacterized protein n=1 Tax=Gaeavirus sp. TaxID=2487767 RepID=A0A3G4ZZ93_9VIRU|nr:MAG: hypothetical protein Gaeavirus14_10 [Gaeavirus sp.]